MFFDGRHHQFRGTCQVDGGRGYLAVPHHPGERIEIASSFEHESGESMPQGMAGELYPGLIRQLLHDGIDRLDRERIVVLCRDQEGIASLVQPGTIEQVFPEYGREPSGYGYYAVFLPLPLDHVHPKMLQVHVLQP